jgi:hypothetical protein
MVYTQIEMADVNPLLADLLANLGEVCRASAIAVWVPVQERVVLQADWRLDQRLYDLLPPAWLDRRGELRAGQHVKLPKDVEIVPIVARDRGLVGVFQYAGPFPTAGARRVFLDETLIHVGELLTRPLPPTVAIDHPGGLLPFDIESDPDEIERRAYSELLSRCGWDVTLAAGALDMQRQAFYNLLEAIGITRPKAKLRRRAA